MKMNGLEVFVGGRTSSIVYRDISTNYIYKKHVHKKHRNHDCVYFVCCLHNCTGTAVYRGDTFTVKRPHNHDPDQRKINTFHVLNRCKERASSENTPVRQIFAEEIAKYPTDTPILDIKDIESTVSKLRNREPKFDGELTVQEFARYLRNSRYGKTMCNEDFFKEYQELPDGSANVIFISPGMVYLLGNTQVLYMDVTNQIIPTPPAFALCCVIHAEEMDMMFPVIFALMTHDTVDAFTELFRYTRGLVQPCNPRTVISCFRDDIQRAVQRVFGEHHAELLGGFKSYAQILKKKLDDPTIDLLNHVKVNEEPTATIVKACFSLPLLPAERCIEGLQVLRHQSDVLLATRHDLLFKVKKFLDYIEDYWFNLVGIASVFHKWKECDWHCQVGTFNVSLLKQTYASMKSSVIWNYIDKLIRCEDRERQRLIKAIEGQRNQYNTKYQSIIKEKVTRSLLLKLEKNEVSVWQFLCDLTEHSYSNDDAEGWTGANANDMEVPADEGHHQNYAMNPWENDPLTMSVLSIDGVNNMAQDPNYQAPTTSKQKRVKREVDVKPGVFYHQMENKTGKKRKIIPSTRYGSNTTTSGDPNSAYNIQSYLSEHIQRQNDILSSLLTQTNKMYESMVQTGTPPPRVIENNVSVHKNLLDSIQARTPNAPFQNTVLCKVCQQYQFQILFRHCGHLCCCKTCWENIKDTRPFCPMCNERVIEAITVRF